MVQAQRKVDGRDVRAAIGKGGKRERGEGKNRKDKVRGRGFHHVGTPWELVDVESGSEIGR